MSERKGEAVINTTKQDFDVALSQSYPVHSGGCGVAWILCKHILGVQPLTPGYVPPEEPPGG